MNGVTISLNPRDVQDGWAREALVINKGDKERNVFFGDDAQAAIRAYLEAGSGELVPLFLRHDNRRGGPGSARTIGRRRSADMAVPGSGVQVAARRARRSWCSSATS